MKLKLKTKKTQFELTDVPMPVGMIMAIGAAGWMVGRLFVG